MGRYDCALPCATLVSKTSCVSQCTADISLKDEEANHNRDLSDMNGVPMSSEREGNHQRRLLMFILIPSHFVKPVVYTDFTAASGQRATAQNHLYLHAQLLTDPLSLGHKTMLPSESSETEVRIYRH